MHNKGDLHPRNRHSNGYDFDALTSAHAPLKEHVAPNKYGNLSINFFDPQAVRALNTALLKSYYDIEWWEIPPSALIPPIPGRADYIHYGAELLGDSKNGTVRCLDVGVGATCIYPIIGRREYGWEFVGCDIDPRSIESSRRIIEANTPLKGHIELRLQTNASDIFEGIIKDGDRFDITICNPPFHDSAHSAAKASQRKLRALKATRKGVLNFEGQSGELWCQGGERAFIERMIDQSRTFKSQCRWFTTLVSNEDNLAPLRRALKMAKVKEHRTIDMHQGNKRSRILAWRY